MIKKFEEERIVVDIPKICQESFNEWMNQSKGNDASSISLASNKHISREMLAHSEILLMRYHEALKKSLAQQGVEI